MRIYFEHLIYMSIITRLIIHGILAANENTFHPSRQHLGLSLLLLMECGGKRDKNMPGIYVFNIFKIVFFKKRER